MTFAHDKLIHCAVMLAAVNLAAMVASPSFAQPQTDRFDALANAPFSENRPTPETIELLKDKLLFQQRVTPLAIHASPALRPRPRLSRPQASRPWAASLPFARPRADAAWETRQIARFCMQM